MQKWLRHQYSGWPIQIVKFQMFFLSLCSNCILPPTLAAFIFQEVFIFLREPLEKGTATHSSILAWRPIVQRVTKIGHDWATFIWLSGLRLYVITVTSFLILEYQLSNSSTSKVLKNKSIFSHKNRLGIKIFAFLFWLYYLILFVKSLHLELNVSFKLVILPQSENC